MQGDMTASSSNARPAESSPEEDVTLATLLERTLASCIDLLERPDLSSNAAQQVKLVESLANLSLCASLIQHLALLSTNETIDELSTPTLRCFLVPYYTGMLELQRRTRDYKTRIEALEAGKEGFNAFMKNADAYDIIDERGRRKLYMLAGPNVNMDQARRREAKIAQYKEEKALKLRIDDLSRKRSELPSNSVSAGSVNADPSDAENEHLRPLLLSQIAYSYIRSHNELSSISQELELLKNAPNMSELPSPQHESAVALKHDDRARKRHEEDQTWRLDKPLQNGNGSAHGARQLIDSRGRPLRPFTILPSNATGSSSSIDTRLRMQNSVFGTSHRLPTMTIDEYLDMEHERGNVLQGGGAKNTEESKREAADKKAYEEEEDSAEGYAREEAGLAKKREWDAYRDEHQRGEGNRMNRG